MSREEGLNGNNRDSAGQQQRQQQQQQQNQQQFYNNQQVVPQSLHLQMQQHQQSLMDENNSSSLVYDRTIKVAKTDYADHGSHGVAAFPLQGQSGENGDNCMMGGGGPAPAGLGAGGGLPSSVQMQLQMQQMARAVMMQQQQQQESQSNNQHQQQQQYQMNQMMPPPPNNAGGYPSLVPGSMGSQMLHLHNNTSNNHQGGGAPSTASGGAGGVGASAAPIMNTTSSGLMQALNAQMAANQAAMNNHMVGGGAGGEGMMTSPLGNAMGMGSNLSNLSRIANLSNMQPGMPGASGGGGGNAVHSGVNNTDMLAPGDIRNGKKRTSPSLPLHPSQLQGGGHPSQLQGGGMMAAVPGSGHVGGLGYNNMGMNAVAEEDESLCASNANSLNAISGGQLNHQLQQHLLQPQQLMNATASMGGGIGQMMASQQQGLLGSALSQAIMPQLGELPNANRKEKVPLPQDNLPEEGHGEVLTNPSIPSANSGLDNAEGNLIVRKGDVLRIPRKNMHSHPPPGGGEKKEGGSPSSKGNNNSYNGDVNVNSNHVEYRVVSLLGQGTFAQVFHCVEVSSPFQRAVAVKIVKNKPAYTRQAAVEIDVFRKLNAVHEGTEGADSENTDDSTTAAGNTTEKSTVKGGGSKSNSASTYSSFDSSDLASTSTSKTNGGSEKAIIRLMHYFMHSSHLCLVFEMLGPNLYELLKKRQFRGLPIAAVRTLVRQATEGIKLLGKRNVVHCDLKPENILMVRNDVDGVISECCRVGNKEEERKLSMAAGGGSNKNHPNNTPCTLGKDDSQAEQYIKLIDFGSACFEGQTTHTYIQSRFYRSPEVLIGLPYDSAIDIWSLGCVAAELFLGLPILPGVHEHDQLGRILEMVGDVPDWMLEKGSKSGKFFKTHMVPNGGGRSRALSHFGPSGKSDGSAATASSAWEFKSRQEYIAHLTEDEKRSKGGLSKLEQQQTNRYFKKKRLEDIVMHHGACNNSKKEKEELGLFVHFLKGVLDPDPWKRWTAHQASMHPFLSGSSSYRIKSTSSSVGGDGRANNTGTARPYDIHWVPPWDASISRRKLMVIQKTKEKEAVANGAVQQQQAAVAQVANSNRRRSINDTLAIGRNTISQSVPESGAIPHGMLPPLSTAGLDIYGSPLKAKHKLEPQSPAVSVASQMAAMADAMSLERARSNISNISGAGMGGKPGSSPPSSLLNNGGIGVGGQAMYHPHHPGYPSALSASLGGVGIPLSYQQLADIGAVPGQMQSNLAGRSYGENISMAQQQQQQQQLASLSGLNDVAFLQPPPPPPTFMGAQSFSGAYYPQGGGMPNSHHPYVESELGYALQRPGVVPSGVMMGNDVNAAFATALRRQSSQTSQSAMLAHQQQQQNQAMLSASLNNLSSSTPQNYGAVHTPGSAMSYSASPGGLLLQKLGLQEQMMLANTPGGGGGAGGTSLLAQQLQDYSSQSDHPQQQQGGGHQAPGMYNSNNPLMGGSSGMINPGSYHGGFDHTGAPGAVPMSLGSSIPYHNMMQSSSFHDFGGNSSSMQRSNSMQLQQQQQHLAQMQSQLRMNASFPVPDSMMYPNGSGQPQNAPNDNRQQPNNGGTMRRPG